VYASMSGLLGCSVSDHAPGVHTLPERCMGRGRHFLAVVHRRAPTRTDPMRCGLLFRNSTQWVTRSEAHRWASPQQHAGHRVAEGVTRSTRRPPARWTRKRQHERSPLLADRDPRGSTAHLDDAFGALYPWRTCHQRITTGSRWRRSRRSRAVCAVRAPTASSSTSVPGATQWFSFTVVVGG
jgi:hypothetical protein